MNQSLTDSWQDHFAMFFERFLLICEDVASIRDSSQGFVVEKNGLRDIDKKTLRQTLKILEETPRRFDIIGPNLIDGIEYHMHVFALAHMFLEEVLNYKYDKDDDEEFIFAASKIGVCNRFRAWAASFIFVQPRTSNFERTQLGEKISKSAFGNFNDPLPALTGPSSYPRILLYSVTESFFRERYGANWLDIYQQSWMRGMKVVWPKTSTLADLIMSTGIRQDDAENIAHELQVKRRGKGSRISDQTVSFLQSNWQKLIPGANSFDEAADQFAALGIKIPKQTLRSLGIGKVGGQ